jgi:HD-GYP domain-containing protein (c-di-GMP phosphodiesterase class II)
MRGLLVATVTLLAGATVFVDEIAHGRRIDDEIVVDGIVGVMLAATAMLASLTVIRLLDYKRGVERQRRLAEAVRSVHEDGHTAAVLTRLASHAREASACERLAVAMREEADPAWSRIVAGDGLPAALLGNRFGVEQGVAGQVFAADEPREQVDWQRLGYASAEACAGASVPISWGGDVQGVMSAARPVGRGKLGPPEVAALTHLAELAALALEQSAVRGHLERAAQVGVEALAAAVDRRDSYTAEHSEEVVELARRVGTRLGISGRALTELEIAARLHDVGKIGIPDAILRKPGPLDPDEWEIVRQHPAWGSEMLARVPELTGVAALIRYEHERWDGRGYPDGLRGEEIPVASRIVFVCDAYHAITSRRPYRAPRAPAVALDELQAQAGSQFDPEAVQALVDVIQAREQRAGNPDPG